MYGNYVLKRFATCAFNVLCNGQDVATHLAAIEAAETEFCALGQNPRTDCNVGNADKARGRNRRHQEIAVRQRQRTASKTKTKNQTEEKGA